MNNKPKEVKHYKNSEYIQIARQLGYSDEIIERIRNAKTELEAERILAEGRHQK